MAFKVGLRHVSTQGNRCNVARARTLLERFALELAALLVFDSIE
jgi:hypothetical protein